MSYLAGGPVAGFIPPGGMSPGAVNYASLDASLQAAMVPMRNRLYNGTFRVNQRGTAAFLVGTGGFVQSGVTSDTWRLSSSAGSQVVPSGPSGYQLAMSRESGTGNVEIYSRVEYQDWYDMVGQPVTLSFDMYRTISGNSSQAMYAGVYTTDGEANFTNTAAVSAGTFVNSVNQKFERFSITGTIPLGSTQQGIFVDFAATNLSTVASGAYLIIRNVQLEEWVRLPRRSSAARLAWSCLCANATTRVVFSDSNFQLRPVALCRLQRGRNSTHRCAQVRIYYLVRRMRMRTSVRLW